MSIIFSKETNQTLVEKLQAQLESLKKQQEKVAATAAAAANMSKDIVTHTPGGRKLIIEERYTALDHPYEYERLNRQQKKAIQEAVSKAEVKWITWDSVVAKDAVAKPPQPTPGVPVSNKKDFYQWAEEEFSYPFNKKKCVPKYRNPVQAEKVISAEEADTMMQDSFRKLNIE